jgi:phosphatidylserine decarboxylase
MTPRDRRIYSIYEQIPRRALTLAVARLSDQPIPQPLRAPLYGTFARIVGANLSEAAQPVDTYPSFDAFFTRTLRDGVRPWTTASDQFGSPADGRVAAHGRIEAGRMVQAKGIDYELADLIHEPALATELDGGLFATVYLSPADYHRVHVPVDAQIERVVHIGGELWPVNGPAVATVPGLFVVNERVVASLRLADGSRGFMVLVGATCVGRMSVDEPRVSISPSHANGRHVFPLDPAWEAAAGDGFGAFHLGSTVVLGVSDPNHTWSIAPSIVEGERIQLGDPLFVR